MIACTTPCRLTEMLSASCGTLMPGATTKPSSVTICPSGDSEKLPARV